MLVLLNGDRTYYTRTGQFGIDKDGYVAQLGSGYRLGVLNSAGQAVDINIDVKKTSAPVATTAVKFTSNLSSTATDATVADIVVYDSLGGAPCLAGQVHARRRQRARGMDRRRHRKRGRDRRSRC